MFLLQEGVKIRYKPTGIIYMVMKITNQFVILNSTDGSSQIMVEKEGVTFPFELEELAEVEPTKNNTGRNSWRIED